MDSEPRLIYWNMLYSGDFELMRPLFRTYLEMLPIACFRTREYFGHEGALIPETTTFFGTYSDHNYGYDRVNRPKSYVMIDNIIHHYNGQLEIAYMMLRYYGFTRDQDFLQSTAVPFVYAVLTFFDQHFRGVRQHFYLKNVSALETWQDCVNDTPDVCGLTAVCDFVLAEKETIGETSSLYSLCRRLRGELPSVPRGRIYGEEVFAPCEYAIDKKLRNVETPELYGVFPYDLYGCCDGSREDFTVAQNTFRHRIRYGNQGWRQDAVFAARLGLAEEAFSMCGGALQEKNPECAFPAYWGPNYDWTPDQCHGCVNSVALIQMLLQSGREGFQVLPAWPKEIGAEFRLPVYGGKFVRCRYIPGKEPEYAVEEF